MVTKYTAPLKPITLPVAREMRPWASGKKMARPSLVYRTKYWEDGWGCEQV